jgi:hypothetical protein
MARVASSALLFHFILAVRIMGPAGRATQKGKQGPTSISRLLLKNEYKGPSESPQTAADAATVALPYGITIITSPRA